MTQMVQYTFDSNADFDYSVEVSKEFETSVVVEFETQTSYESSFNAHTNIDVDVGVDGNFSGFHADVQSQGSNTATEVNLSVVTTSNYSSIVVSGYSASGTKVPTNAAPNALNDTVYVELGDVKTFNAIANDTDTDGTIVPSTLQILTAPLLGAAVANANGTITYDDAIANTAADNSAVDTLTYQVSDNGGASGQATVTVNVIDPLVETSTDMEAGPNGQALSLTLTTEERTANTSSFVNVSVLSGDLQKADINVAFIYDASGSVGITQYNQQILAIQNAIDALRAEYSGAENVISVQLIRFATGSDHSQTYDLYNAALDDIAGLAITDYTGGNTNYEAALDNALAFFAQADPSGTESNFVLFASDGMPNTPNSSAHLDEATALKDVASVTAVGFGPGISLATLDGLDNTGGAQQVNSAAELRDVFANSPLFGAELVSFALSLSVNGGPQTLIADESDLTSLGGGDYSLNLASVGGLTGALSGSNVFTAVAVFDTDGDLNTLGDRVTLSSSNTVEGAVPDAFWV